MAVQPSNATVTVDGTKFNAFTVHLGIETLHDHTGVPMMGAPQYSIDCCVNMHDTDNVPFGTLSQLYQLANGTTRDKVVDIKVEFWTDESQQDAICTYSFRGWISAFHTSGGGGGNHTLAMTFVPELNKQQYVDLQIGN